MRSHADGTTHHSQYFRNHSQGLSWAKTTLWLTHQPLWRHVAPPGQQQHKRGPWGLGDLEAGACNGISGLWRGGKLGEALELEKSKIWTLSWSRRACFSPQTRAEHLGGVLCHNGKGPLEIWAHRYGLCCLPLEKCTQGGRGNAKGQARGGSEAREGPGVKPAPPHCPLDLSLVLTPSQGSNLHAGHKIGSAAWHAHSRTSEQDAHEV